MATPRTVAVFRSEAFGHRETEEAGDVSFGQDVARWLIECLAAAGVTVDAKPDREDFGWFFNFIVDGIAHCCVVGSRPVGSDDMEWIVWIERRRGFIASLFQLRAHGVQVAAARTIHQVLHGEAGRVSNLRWYSSLPSDATENLKGALEP